MVQIKCKTCKKEFYAKPSWIENGFGKYCSRECGYESRRKGKNVKCSICGKEAYKSGKALAGSKSGKYFCGKSCQTIWRNNLYKGSNHANWKGGRFTYRNIMERSSIPKVCKLCGIDDARVLLVHHMDVNNMNNELENLVWLCHNCHFLVHHNNKEIEKLKNKLIMKIGSL